MSVAVQNFPKTVDSPNTVGKAFINAGRHPIETVHNHINYLSKSGKVHTVHTTRKVTDLVNRVIELFNKVFNTAYCAVLQLHLRFFSDLSKTLYAPKVAYDALSGEEITHYDYLSYPLQCVKTVATVVLNVSQTILFTAKYIIPTIYTKVTSDFLHFCATAAYNVGGDAGLWIVNAATSVAMKTINKVAATAFMLFEAYQLWSKYSDPDVQKKETEGKMVSTLLSSVEFLGKAVTCTMALAGVGGLIPIIIALAIDIIGVTGHNQKMVDEQCKIKNEAAEKAAKEESADPRPKTVKEAVKGAENARRIAEDAAERARAIKPPADAPPVEDAA